MTNLINEFYAVLETIATTDLKKISIKFDGGVKIMFIEDDIVLMKDRKIVEHMDYTDGVEAMLEKVKSIGGTSTVDYIYMFGKEISEVVCFNMSNEDGEVFEAMSLSVDMLVA